MQTLVKSLKTNVKLKYQSYVIDNVFFRLHYRFTTLLLILATMLLTSRELIGEHIKCITDKAIPEKILNRYCFVTTTYTVVKYLNETMLSSNEIAHPGVGAMGLNSEEPVKHHAYYQWVPFVLFGQAILFYIPHLIWKSNEGGVMKILAFEFEYATYSTVKTMSAGIPPPPPKPKVKLSKPEKPSPKKNLNIPSLITVDEKFDKMKKSFKEHIFLSGIWSYSLIGCELLNLLNVLLNIWITNEFLGGQFLRLGGKVMREGFESRVDPLDVVFPKITKCAFHKYGPSGTLQAHDAICVMALNIINEKIYLVLWFWFVILLGVSTVALLWRILSFVMFSRSGRFNKIVFAWASAFQFGPWLARYDFIIEHCRFIDWLFLVYLAKNMDIRVFKKFFKSLFEEESQDYADRLIDLDSEDSPGIELDTRRDTMLPIYER